MHSLIAHHDRSGGGFAEATPFEEAPEVSDQVVFDYRIEHGQWPTIRDLEIAVGSVIAVDAYCKRILKEALWWGDNRNAMVSLSFRQQRRCKGVDRMYSPLVEALPLIRQVYFESRDRPWATHRFFLDQGWPAERVGHLWRAINGMMLPFVGSAGSTPEKGEWSFEITPKIDQFLNVHDEDDLLQRLVRLERNDHRSRRRGLVASRLRNAKKHLGGWLAGLLAALLATLLAALFLGR